MQGPVVYQYQLALDEFRRAGEAHPLLKRMSELISLLDLSTTLNSGLTNQELLDAALLIVLGEMQVGRGGLLVRALGDEYELRASRGLPAGAPSRIEVAGLAGDAVVFAGEGPHQPILDAFGFVALCPIAKAGRTIAVLGLGPRAGGRTIGDEEAGFLRSVAACAATPIENGLIYDELRRVNQRLSLRVFQLRNLFEISRELGGSFDEATTKNLVTGTLMGHLMVSRCALYLGGAKGLALVHQRGLRTEDVHRVEPMEAQAVLAALRFPMAVADLPRCGLTERLQNGRLSVAVPLILGERAEGFVALGERVSGVPFTEEDHDFVRTLGSQAVAALENLRLHELRVQTQRQDREMQIAREIQESLFPSCRPQVPGFEIDAESHSCYQVGGDLYDFIPLADGRLAFTVADVSGKGAPASILMASVHASLRALAGGTPPDVLMRRINQFLYENTQANRYVTLFYGELEPATRRLTYVNAGHVPPFWIGSRGDQRLTEGGPVLGLLEEVDFEVGQVELLPGDLVCLVTDGASEALSPEGEEFGDARIMDTLRGQGAAPASQALGALVAAVNGWAGSAGCSDDLTALVLRAV